MKNITFLLCLLITTLGFSQIVVLEDFEGTTSAPVVNGFEGVGGASVTADPLDAGNSVLEIISVDSGQGWQGASVIMQEHFMNVAAGNITVEVDVYSTVAFNLLGKVEGGQAGAPDSAQEASYTTTGAWQTLTFTLNNPLDTTTQAANGDYETLSLFPNWILGGGPPAWVAPPGNFTLYVDNISAVEGAAIVPPETCSDGIMNQDETGIDCGGVCAPCTAGTPVVMEDFEGTPGFAGNDGLTAATAVDPLDAGNTVLEVISSSSGQGWQGADVIMQDFYMDVSNPVTVSVDVYSTVAFDMLGKVSDGQDGAPDSAQEGSYTTTGAWQTITFTFNNPLDNTTQNANGDYGIFSVFPNWILQGSGGGWDAPPGDFTLYLDNVRAVQGASTFVPETCSDGIMNQDETGIDCGGVCAPCATPGTPEVMEDFEGTTAAPGFGAFEGLASAALAADPLDAGNTVLEMVSSSSGQGWQGAEIIMQENYMDVTNPLTVSVDVYSTVAFDMLGRVSGGQAGAPDSAQEGSYTATGTWQTITFTLNNPLDNTTQNANGEYDRIALFPNWILQGSGGGWVTPPGDFTLYIDNVTAVRGAVIPVPETCSDGIMNQDETGIDCGGVCAPCTGGTPEIMEDFEGTTAAPGFAVFDGIAASLATDPLNGSNTVLEVISSSSGQGWQGAEVIMQENYMDLTNPLTVSVDVYSTVAFDVLGKVVAGVAGAPDSAQEGSYTATGTWQTITFTFDNPLDNTTQNANGEYERFAVFPNWILQGSGGGWSGPNDFTIYIDNISAVRGAVIPPMPTNYVYNNGWAPSDPTGVSGAIDDININGGDLIVSANLECNNLNIQAGASMTIESGVTVTTTATTLFSQTSSFPSLIVDGFITGTVNYHRMTSIVGINDLASPPLAGGTFGPFAAVNLNLPQQGDLRAYGPYDTVIGEYVNYDTVLNAGTVLESGVGYRAATIDGNRLIYSGTPLSTDVLDVAISDSEESKAWNLIGNPYSSYMDFDTFFNANLSQFESTGAFLAVYGYDGSATNGWTVWNLATIADNAVTELIAPGQGFFVKSAVGGGLVDYTTSMRRTGSSDDFILGRNADNPLNVALSTLNLSSDSNNANTSIYFIEGTTRGLDPGYDAGSYRGASGDFSIFTNLVEENEGLDMQIQSLDYNDFNDVIIPLGIKATAGTALTISLGDNSTVPANVNIYLEDTLQNTVTLLNTSDFTFTPSIDMVGTGRFFLRYSADTLSIGSNDIIDQLIVYTNENHEDIIIKGVLDSATTSVLYDIHGRVVLSQDLEQISLTNTIDVSTLSSGVYIIQISNTSKTKTQKIIIK